MSILDMLSKARQELTVFLDSQVEERNVPSFILVIDNISISLMYSLLAARWIESRQTNRNTFNESGMTLPKYVSQYIPSRYWGKQEYGLSQMSDMDFISEYFSTPADKELIGSIVSPILNHKDFSILDETLFTSYRDRLNSYCFDMDDKHFIVDSRVQQFESYYTPKDLANFIVSQAWERSQKRKDMVVLDPTSGSGNLLIAYLQKIQRELGEEAMLYSARNCIYGVDMDIRAIDALGMALFVMSYRLDETPAKIGSRLVYSNVLMILKDKVIPRNFKVDICLMNPPYVTFRKGVDKKSMVPLQREIGIDDQQIHEQTLAIHTYIIDYMFHFINPNGVMSMVIPSNIISGADRFKRFVNRIISSSENLHTFNFDTIPTPLFRGVSQRSSVISLNVNRVDSVSSDIYSTRMMRWNSNERIVLFQNLTSTKVDPVVIAKLGMVPNISFPLENILLRSLIRQPILQDLAAKKSKYQIDTLSAARYFIYASRGPKGKVNVGTKTTYVKDEISQHILYTYINSNLFYWYWRSTTDGYMIQRDFLNGCYIPIPRSPAQIKKLIELSNKLKNAEKKCGFSYRKGSYNINFNKDYGLLQEIDAFYLKIMGLKHKDFKGILKTSKSNNLFFTSYPF